MTSIALFDSIEDDGLVKELLSFCDFQSLNSMRQTCQRLMNLSDETMDYMAVSTIDNLPIECEYSSKDWSCRSILRGTLKRGWTTEHRSTTALIDAAIENCTEFNLEELDFDEDRASFLLQTTGAVHSADFARDVDGYDGYDSDEDGWDVRISRHLQESPFDAAGFATMMIKKLAWKGAGDTANLMHGVLCLLRKADILILSRKKATNRHSDNGSGSTTTCILMKLPSSDNDDGWEEFEFQCDEGYQRR